MTQIRAGGSAPPRDTPNVPPPPSRSGRLLVVLVVAAAAIAAAWLAVRVVRRVFAVAALLFAAPRRQETIVLAVPAEQSYAGPRYRIEFYDGNFRQLADRDITMAVDLDSPLAAAHIAVLGRRLADSARLRDGQICEHPRMLLKDASGRIVYEWLERW